MKVFDDRITLLNGGKLPPDNTVERLMEPHESHLRNRLMASVFYLAGFIEAWGRGYEKIRNAFEVEELEMPVFEEVRGCMMALIKREKFLEIQAKKEVNNQSDPKSGQKSREKAPNGREKMGKSREKAPDGREKTKKSRVLIYLILLIKLILG